MSKDALGRINDHFAIGSRDLTPPAVKHAVRVLYMPGTHDQQIAALCAMALSGRERSRLKRFASPLERDRFVQRRAFRRFCGATASGQFRSLSDVEFKKTENGRPWLAEMPGTWFSFSSCRSGFLGAWSQTHAMGVDIEDRTGNLEVTRLARVYFSAAEARLVENSAGPARLATFCRLWSLKEAALKSVGQGLPFGLQRFVFRLNPAPRLVAAPAGYGGPTPFDAQLIDGAGACAALVTRRRS